jgi:hypothetical protein
MTDFVHFYELCYACHERVFAEVSIDWAIAEDPGHSFTQASRSFPSDSLVDAARQPPQTFDEYAFAFRSQGCL